MQFINSVTTYFEKSVSCNANIKINLNTYELFYTHYINIFYLFIVIIHILIYTHVFIYTGYPKMFGTRFISLLPSYKR